MEKQFRTKVAVSLRMSPEIKAAGEKQAKAGRRSFAAYLEWLIDQDCARQPASETISLRPSLDATVS